MGMCISFSRFQPVTLLWMYASNTSKETKVIVCMLGRILIPELLLHGLRVPVHAEPHSAP